MPAPGPLVRWTAPPPGRYAEIIPIIPRCLARDLRVALVAMVPPLALLAEMQNTARGKVSTRPVEIPRRGGGGSDHRYDSGRRGRRQEGRGAVEALAVMRRLHDLGGDPNIREIILRAEAALGRVPR